jgi:hypothetical protein
VPGGEVGMYVCGVTPYDDSHIGHARAYVAFDVLYRFPLASFFSGFGPVGELRALVIVMLTVLCN